ncbi:DNA-directed RNA polymerase sigma-70 factor [Iodidimonas muriae]|uniref:DNA-directed RNA polymerase sigma-70 factor n=1 Tax=Iodidimonas muriae TaxID=261467 RepID=A0ABQ2L621_9PROT|nr:sigma-70 family RNA polymerase sigma factor [Iodidimonas muriae]GER06402.1 DNA-directed RNA polymerase sigma-70 factor [Kordiimonadales bacterium JCM 17843]GGO04633.1 DNA-directed RNA polymerase sigma-70 factor [Iodidimonas muriae]
MITRIVDRKNRLLDTFLDKRDGLYAMLRARLGESQDVQDILQDVWLRLSAVESPDKVANPSAYVYRTTSNMMLDHLRSMVRRQNHMEGSGSLPEELPTAQPSPEAAAYYRARLLKMRLLLNELSPKCQKAFLLSRCEGLTYGEIGQRLGISDNMVKKYLIKALAHLRTHMPVSEDVDRY